MSKQQVFPPLEHHPGRLGQRPRPMLRHVHGINVAHGYFDSPASRAVLDYLSGHVRIFVVVSNRFRPEPLDVQMFLAVGMPRARAARALTDRMFFCVL